MPSRDVIRSNTIGMVIGAAFGLWWFMTGATALGGAMATPLIILGIAVAGYTFVMGVLLLRRIRRWPRSEAANPFTSRIYLLSVLIEIVGIPVATRLLTAWDVPQYITPTISIIVGLHLFGVAVAFKRRALLVVGSAMCVLALFAMLVLPATITAGQPPRMIDLWSTVIGLGNGTVFLLGCAFGQTRLWGTTTTVAAS